MTETAEKRAGWFNWPRGIGAASVTMAGLGAMSGGPSVGAVLIGLFGVALLVIDARR